MLVVGECERRAEWTRRSGGSKKIIDGFQLNDDFAFVCTKIQRWLLLLCFSWSWAGCRWGQGSRSDNRSTTQHHQADGLGV